MLASPPSSVLCPAPPSPSLSSLRHAKPLVVFRINVRITQPVLRLGGGSNPCGICRLGEQIETRAGSLEGARFGNPRNRPAEPLTNGPQGAVAARGSAGAACCKVPLTWRAMRARTPSGWRVVLRSWQRVMTTMAWNVSCCWSLDALECCRFFQTNCKSTMERATTGTHYRRRSAPHRFNTALQN